MKKPLHGGDIHETSFIETASGRRFALKEAVSDKGEDYFEAEADGLEALRGHIRVPDVLGFGTAFLLLEWLEPVPQGRNFFPDFGRALARMHRTTGTHYGYARDNYIGRLPQNNTPETSLATFFAERRLRPLVRLLGFSAAIEKVCERLPELFAPINEPPALLHGDLWAGNFLSTHEGPALIDPAVYYGPREADIAMTKLFGGLPEPFYKAYEEAYPLPDGWRDRVDLFNLYHLMTHAVMFSGAYGNQAMAVIQRYT